MALAVVALVAALLALSPSVAAQKSKQQQQQQQQRKKPADVNDNKGNTPFFLQDPRDQTCLGPNGFTVCDERSLWVLTRRAGKKTYSLVSLLNPSPYGMCLERKYGFLGLLGTDRVGMGLCSQKGSKSWDFAFVDKTHVKLSTNNQCLVRGKKKYLNSVSVQHCNKGEFLPLVYHPTSVHEAGFYLKAADGACFDGERFRSCEGRGADSLLWGVGIKYVGGKANRYFFNFNPHERSYCIVAKGSKVEKGPCSHGGALRWGLADGKLSAGNGKQCLARLHDNTGVMVGCGEANEYISMDIPTVYSEEDIARMLKNQESLSPEEKAALAQLVQKQKYQASA